MKVSEINGTFDLVALRNILTSNKITDKQKAQFIKDNSLQIKNIIESTPITGKEFKFMMHNRPLIKFRPLKNSFTKRGDKKILAETLDVDPIHVDSYINEVYEAILERGAILHPTDKTEAVKTYVYRHGTKDQVVAFLDYELSKAKDLLGTLYSTLAYNTEGMADYFSRPIHRMDNETMAKLYNVIDKHLNASVESGALASTTADLTAKWALVKIYEIQNNSKLINAVKAYKAIT
jgi:predicted RNA-binding protein